MKRTYSMRCSYLEIYNESISDLLTGAGGLQIRVDPRTGPFVEGLSSVDVHNGGFLPTKKSLDHNDLRDAKL